jgi:hypothetical protein
MAPPINRLIKQLIIKDRSLTELPPAVPTKKCPQYTFTTKLIDTLTTQHQLINTTTAPTTNLTPHELLTLRHLRSNQNIIIKPVDKNLGTAVIEKGIYLRMCLEQHLSDSTTYTQLDHDPLAATRELITAKLTSLRQQELITETIFKRLRPDETTTLGTFYALPKLHKRKLESRPIVSNVTHPTRHISQHVHDLLYQTAITAHSYVPNSLTLIRQLASIRTTKSTFIITADIKSLYTNLPNRDGIDTVTRTVINDNSNKHRHKGHLVRSLLSLVLENNVFSFNDSYYKQINGTAMGTIMAPTYANVFLRSKEESGLKPWLPLCPPSPPITAKNILLFRRYIDDILTIYDNHDNSMPRFIRDLKAAYAPLELTISISRKNAVFLDTELTINDITGQIDHQLYKKPISNKTYIPSSSLHPKHTLNNIIYNDLLRANRLCNTLPQRNRHETRIITNALRQGYKRPDLLKLQAKARRRANHDSSEATVATEATRTIVTMTYNGSRTEKLAQELRAYWSQHASPLARLMIAYRANNNLKRLLVRSKAPSQPPTRA